MQSVLARLSFPLCGLSVVQSGWSASSLLITVCARGVVGCACAHVQLCSALLTGVLHHQSTAA